MPYNMDNLPQAIREQYSTDALKRFIAVFNDIMAKTGDEGRAMAAAHTAAQASGKVQIAEAHAQIAIEMASRGIAHEAADAVDALVKTTLELPDSIVLVPGCVSVEATSPDSPGDEPTFIIKLESLTDEAVTALLEALPVSYGIIKFDPADSQETKLYNLVLERTKHNTIDVWTASQQGLTEDELEAEKADSAEAVEDSASKAAGEPTFNTRIIKADNEQRMVYGVVMEPDSVDTQGDFAHPQEIEKAAHDYLERKQKLGFMHKMFGFGNKLRIMESYLAPCDFEMNGETVKKGSWVMSVRVLEEALWQAVKKGEVTGFSIGGSGKRVTIEPAPA